MPCWAWVAPIIWCFIPSWLLSAKWWNFIKSGYEILKLSIKCTRLKNSYRYGTHSNSSHSLKAFRKTKKKKQDKANLLINWVSCPFEARTSESHYAQARFTLGVRADVQLKIKHSYWCKSWNQPPRALH
jgi:hypothetical protein